MVRPIRSTSVVMVTAAGLLLSACSSSSSPSGSPSGSAECTNSTVIADWPIKRRLAQLLMGGVATVQGESSIDAAVNAVAKGKIGGVNFLGANSAVYADGQLAQAFDAGGEVPPFLAVDEEGGRVQRLEYVTGYVPSARSMAQDMSPNGVKREATKIGRTMRSLWLNMDLAPDVDVSSQSDYEVIGDRSFSDDPETVTEYAGAFAQGLRKAGVIPVLKHFPGLGSGSGNTDLEEASTPPLAALKKSDLIPYETLLQDEPVGVMVTNASVPGLTKGKPATLASPTYRLLRDKLGFQGVVMTDSLSAAAIAGRMGVPQAVVSAIAAGADLALWDSVDNLGDVVKQLKKAVAKGRITNDRVNASVDRILSLKHVNLCGSS